MPARHKSVTTLVAEAAIFIGMFAIVGHIAANVWDRVCIQSEITQMKSSLYSLKNAVTNIGQAYDTLYTEIQSIPDAQSKRLPRRNVLTDKGKSLPIDVHTSYDKQKRNGRDFYQECRPTSKNTTTWTKYLQKSACVGQSFFDDPRMETICNCIQDCYDLKEEQ